MTAQEILENVEKALTEIRPFLASDGGNIKLLSIEAAFEFTVFICLIRHQFGVNTAIFQQLNMFSRFGNFTFVKDQYSVTFNYTG